MKTIAPLLLLAQPIAVPANPPVQPMGKWTIEYADAACILSRDYGTGPTRQTLGFKPSPLDDDIQIVALAPGAVTKPVQSIRATLTLQPSGRVIDGLASVYAVKTTNQVVTTLTTEREGAADVARSTSLSIATAAGPSTSFAVPGMNGAAAALRACQDDLLKQWGIDPAERKVPLPTPSPPLSRLITADDYPSEAVAAHAEGTAVIVWTIQPDGRIADCHVVHSSGSKALDTASCTLFTRRARYAPPLGLDGKPTSRHALRGVVWRLP